MTSLFIDFSVEMLAAKKKSYADYARQINLTKMDIDQSRLKLDQLKDEREQTSPQYNEDGDIIISEAEYLEIKRVSPTLINNML